MSYQEQNVDKVAYYNQGKIEVIDFIQDQKLNYPEGNVVKYICRYKYKGTPLLDLKKAKKYIDFLIIEEEKKAEELRQKDKMN